MLLYFISKVKTNSDYKNLALFLLTSYHKTEKQFVELNGIQNNEQIVLFLRSYRVVQFLFLILFIFR